MIKTVFLVTPRYPPEVGGAATYFSHLSMAVDGMDGYEAVVLADEEPIMGTEVERFYGHNGVPVLRVCGRNDAIVQALDKGFEPDILHIHNNAHDKDKLFRGVDSITPIVYDCRDTSVTKGDLEFGHRKQYMATSEVVRERLLELDIDENDITISKPAVGVDEPNSDFIEDTDRFRLAYVGDFIPHKGAHIIMNAVGNMIEKGPIDMEFVIAGDYTKGVDTNVEEIDSKIEYINYLGRVDHSDALGVIQNSDAIIFASESEGGPRTAYEAIELDTPIISTDVGIVKEMAGEAAIIVNREVHGICFGIEHMYNNLESYKKAAKERGHGRGDLETVRSTLSTVYDNLL